MFVSAQSKIKLLLLSTLGLFIMAAPSVAVAQNTDELCGGANLSFSERNQSCNRGGNPEGKVDNLIQDIVNIFSVIVGIAAVIMIIYGGFRFITSGGDSGNVSAAKNTVLYALVGLIIVALAQFIVKFVLARITT